MYGLKVGDPPIGTGFWNKGINTTSEEKLQLENLKKVDDETQTSTRWNHKLTAFPKVVEVNAQEVQVEETSRKRTNEVAPQRPKTERSKSKQVF